jgi:hypothetical protein
MFVRAAVDGNACFQKQVAYRGLERFMSKRARMIVLFIR